MDHHAIDQELFAFYDGELTAAKRRVIEDHVSDCATCRAQLAQWRHVAGTIIQRSSGIVPSDVFVERVMGRLTRPRAGGMLRVHRLLDLRWLVPALTLAAAAFIFTTSPAPRAVSVETLLLADEPEPATWQQVLIAETPSPEVILGLLMEETS